MSAKRIFTQEQIDWVRDNIQNMSTRECASAFSETFGEQLGQTQLRRLMKNNGISASSLPNNHTPVGTERYSHYYKCMMVKVADSNVAGIQRGDERFRHIRNNSWKLKQNVVWEQEHGKSLPAHHVVIFLDVDRMNYEPDNLYAVPLCVAGTIHKMQMESEDPDIYKTALIWGELYFLLKNKRRDKHD